MNKQSNKLNKLFCPVRNKTNNAHKILLILASNHLWEGENGRIGIIKQNRIATNQRREREKDKEIDLLQFSNINQVFQRMSKYAELTKHKKPKEEIEFNVQ